MGARNRHARTSTNDVVFIHEKIVITLTANGVYKSTLYSVKKRIIDGKVKLPSIKSKTGNSPFLVGECSKGKIRFYWN